MSGDVLGEFGKAEIGYLGLAVIDEDIGDLEVSVDDVFLGQIE